MVFVVEHEETDLLARMFAPWHLPFLKGWKEQIHLATWAQRLALYLGIVLGIAPLIETDEKGIVELTETHAYKQGCDVSIA